jgi:dephospho-CoA kinase
VGLTGGIGSGKSVVAMVFRHLGVPVYQADIEAKKLYADRDVIREVVSLFGNTVIGENGLIDRARLASIVFKDSSKLENLNSILHPRVEEHFLKWLVEHKESPYIIHEAAILFESGFDKFFDKIITVTAPLELCILRVMERDGVSAFQVEQRMKKQWGQELKASKSDFVLVNNGKRLLLPQILNIHRMFLAE